MTKLPYQGVVIFQWQKKQERSVVLSLFLKEFPSEIFISLWLSCFSLPFSGLFQKNLKNLSKTCMM